MFVPKIPKRSDFCGCPPCHLCFDWVEPAPPVELTTETPLEIRISAEIKIATDLVGRIPTPAEVKQVAKGLEGLHTKANLESTTSPEDKGKANQQRQVEFYEARALEEMIERNVAAAAKPKVEEKVPITGIRTLDDMTEEELNESIKPKVDESLVRRENKGKKTVEQKLEEMSKVRMRQREEMLKAQYESYLKSR